MSLSAVVAPPAKPHYTSERAWLDHLRVMAELPYPSWLLMPGVARVLRAHLDWDLIILAWDDKETLQPTDFWIDPVKGELLQRYMARLGDYVQEVPIQPLLQTRGRIYRLAETDPRYEDSAIYREFFEPYGVRWGATVPVYLGEDGLAFLGLLRRRDRGRYSDADQDRLDKVSEALSSMDRRRNPLAALPPAGFREASVGTLLLNAEGRIAMQAGPARDLLFMAHHTGLGPPDWVLPGLQALPAEVAAAARALLAQRTPGQRVEHRLRQPWGSFDFVLELTELDRPPPEPVLSVTIRHHEPLDITVARKLWGWPLSPQEKRIVVASTRAPGRTELAQALGLSESTLRAYINELQGRLGVASRQELIEQVMASA